MGTNDRRKDDLAQALGNFFRQVFSLFGLLFLTMLFRCLSAVIAFWVGGVVGGIIAGYVSSSWVVGALTFLVFAFVAVALAVTSMFRSGFGSGKQPFSIL